MRISSVLLENIKKFGSKESIFSFGGHPGMHTVSGGNGSGKTAIFRSVQIFQKIFFFDQLEEENDSEYYELYEKISNDLDGLLRTENGLIDVAFKDNEFSFRVELRISKNHSGWQYNFKSGSDGDIDLLSKYWNIKNPTEIVAFIDASKSFSDFGVGFDDISLLSRREIRRRFILDCIFEPEKTLQSIYRKTVIDHVQYRIDPKRTYHYFRDANSAIKKISGNIEVANISATKLDGQLVIVGKTNKDSQLFDVKDFSSGERALYLTLLFLFYLPNIGVLIIDEPENHLHESLLCKFYDFLEDFIKDKSVTSQENIDNENHESSIIKSGLEQIFLTTHSRALIYKNMERGYSYSMANNEIVRILASDVERSLRASGISTVHSKTLFVEGDTEASLMSEFFEQERIKVTPVNSCNEVISYFEKIAAIRTTIHGAAFCFAIDSDNRTLEDIKKIQSIDADFFDQSFCILDCHEIENLFIDEKLILDVVNKIRNGMELEEIDIDLIQKTMSNESIDLYETSRSKYIASGLRLELKRTISDPITDAKKMRSVGIEDLIKNTITLELKETITNEAKRLQDNFEKLWKEDWKKYVDGKAFIGRLCQKLSSGFAPTHSTIIKKMIIKRIKENPEKYSFGVFYKNIVNKFNIQGAL